MRGRFGQDATKRMGNAKLGARASGVATSAKLQAGVLNHFSAGILHRSRAVAGSRWAPERRRVRASMKGGVSSNRLPPTRPRRGDFGAICKQGRQALADARPDYSSVSLTLFMPNGRHQREAEHHEEADESAQRSQDTTGVIGVHQAA